MSFYFKLVFKKKLEKHRSNKPLWAFTKVIGAISNANAIHSADICITRVRSTIFTYWSVITFTIETTFFFEDTLAILSTNVAITHTLLTKNALIIFSTLTHESLEQWRLDTFCFIQAKTLFAMIGRKVNFAAFSFLR